MTFRVKIITPLFANEADLQRRQRRYLERVGSETKVKVVNLPEGPATLDRPNDMQRSNEAVYQEAMKTSCRSKRFVSHPQGLVSSFGKALSHKSI